MTIANVAKSEPYLQRARHPGDRDALAAAIHSSDYIFLYFVLFTASAALFRFGSINTYLWYVIYVWTTVRVCLELPALFTAIIRNWVVFIWPVLALVSIVWSASPGVSLRGGLQLLMTTLISIFIGSRFTIRQILTALCAALSIGALASIALLIIDSPDAFNNSGGFRGIFAHKNTLGLRMNILIAAAFVLFASTPKMRLLCGIAMGIATYVLILTESATSQILALITPGIIFGLYAVRRGAWPFALVGAAITVIASVLLTGLLASGTDPVSYVLNSFGKDATLTGRTWVWDIGIDEISKHPILGGGYQAFWSNSQSTEVLWIRHVLLETVNGFHNVGVEVWNDLGIPGILSLIGVLTVYTTKSFFYYRTTSSTLGQFPMFFLIIVLISATMNNSFFRQHELVHVLICTFFAAMALNAPSKTPRAVTTRRSWPVRSHCETPSVR